ncbi:glycosyltransferase family 87 protein [Rhodopseudomonas sp.]|uniref:glycosyltransferase family 87 protein n=1 Tax=Rhodopseudomonas sp. TaxID=1078 RepID=UPI003B3BCEF5
MPGQFAPRLRQLHWYEIALIGVVALALCIYLPIVVKRSALQGFGDVQVFFRAGWAVWTGYPLYEVADHHGWTYHYPPFFALLMGPFGYPLEGYPRPSWALPLQTSVAVWYAFSAALLLIAVDWWARALERDAPPLGQRAWNAWWMLRIGPLAILMPYIGDGLGRGQPTALVLLTMVGFLVLYAKGRVYSAAFALALGFTIKLFPIVLLLFPILRRDVRTVAAVAGFSAFFLFVVPVLCLGPAEVIKLYVAMWTEHLSGIFTGAPNDKIAAEITFTSYDMLSIGAMLARIAAGGLPAEDKLPLFATLGQLAFDAVFISALVWVGHGRFWRLDGPQPQMSEAVLICGAVLCASLPLVLSVSQPNYVAFVAPLVAVVLWDAWRRSGETTLVTFLVLWACVMWIGMFGTEGGVWEPLRVIGLATPAIAVLLGCGLVCLRRAR